MLLAFSVLNMCLLFGQSTPTEKPKLVVGIVVDQMRFDQLYKYQDRFSETGFKRLINDGFSYKNANYSYIPTVTAAGHATIYTGTTPSIHGIIGNSWYKRSIKDDVGNVEDARYPLIGNKAVSKEGRSPNNLQSPTIGDQLRMSTNFRSKVISVSFKDRGAILPGGFTANGAYWHDWETSPGYFVTSSFYMDKLPKWVDKFNKEERSDRALNTSWKTLYPISSYKNSAPDNNKYEQVLGGKETPTFPYDFKKLRKKYRESGMEYLMMWISPAGNTLLTEFAIEAIANENLGIDTDTDLLNISYSVPDVMGHTFGPQSVEIEDVYLRLDLEISNLLNYLDKKVGKNQYTVFLTADHAAIPVASYLQDKKLPTGIARTGKYSASLNEYLFSKTKQDSLVLHFDGEQVYLNHKRIVAGGLKLQKIQEMSRNFLLTKDAISVAITASDLQTNEYRQGIRHLLQNGYQKERSGDISLSFKPGYIQSTNDTLKVSDVKGTTHGSGWAYDTHVPLVWYGNGIPKGNSVREVAVKDISPTLAMLLNLQLPSGNSGIVCKEIFESKN